MSRPASKFVSPLSEEDRQFLEQTWREHQTHTVRCRAHAVLLSNQGRTVSELQQIFGISKPTALGWIDRWEQQGREGLYDAPRPGGPPILDEQEREEILKPLLNRFPRNPKKVLRLLRERTGKQISRTTLRRMAHRLGLRWKRFRRRQKQADPQQFQLAMEEIAELQSMPDLRVAYFDESAFSLQGVVPYGWQPIGERFEVPIGDERGNIQVLGIQQAEGKDYGYLHRGKVYGKTVREVFDDFSSRIRKPTVIILDNASVHTCHLVADRMELWNERDLYFYFLPPHSPELNAIERLWEKLKYQILPVDCWETVTSLVNSLVHVFDQRGEAILMPSLQSN